MATAITADNYLQQIHEARIQLNTCFRRAHELLTIRKANLLKILEDIQTYYENEINSDQEELQDLERSKQFLKTTLRENDTLNKALAPINDQILQIRKQFYTRQTLKFEWNNDLEKDLEYVGEIITTTTADPQPVFPEPTESKSNSTPIPEILKLNMALGIYDYKNASIPVISCCFHKKSKVPRELYYPRGLAIEPKTGRIYLADSGNHRVQVFTSDGEYCFQFKHKMNSPWGICINNCTVYVSQWHGNCINLYKLDGDYLNKVGDGSSQGQFNNPAGIAVCANTGHLYVCNYTSNRLQVFNNNLKLHSMLGNNTVNSPRDVNLTNELVIVLDQGDPCIHIFSSTDYTLLSSAISRGADKQIVHSLFFAIDVEANIVLTDIKNHCVKVFGLAGEFIAQFGKEGHSVGEFTRPTGVIIGCENRCVVVSENMNTALQIF